MVKHRVISSKADLTEHIVHGLAGRLKAKRGTKAMPVGADILSGLADMARTLKKIERGVNSLLREVDPGDARQLKREFSEFKTRIERTLWRFEDSVQSMGR